MQYEQNVNTIRSVTCIFNVNAFIDKVVMETLYRRM